LAVEATADVFYVFPPHDDVVKCGICWRYLNESIDRVGSWVELASRGVDMWEAIGEPPSRSSWGGSSTAFRPPLGPPRPPFGPPRPPLGAKSRPLPSTRI